jgi:ABC-type sugar transport system permease subunit
VGKAVINANAATISASGGGYSYPGDVKTSSGRKSYDQKMADHNKTLRAANAAIEAIPAPADTTPTDTAPVDTAPVDAPPVPRIVMSPPPVVVITLVPTEPRNTPWLPIPEPVPTPPAPVTVTEPGGATTFSLHRFGAIVAQRGFAQSAINSFIFSLGSAVLALVMGGVMAWLVERTNTPLKPLAYLTTIISMGTPYVLYVSAWLLLLAKSGPINNLYRQYTGTSDLLINVYGLGGMILIEGLLWSPLVFLLLGATLRNFNPELEEAARMAGAGASRCFAT